MEETPTEEACQPSDILPLEVWTVVLHFLNRVCSPPTRTSVQINKMLSNNNLIMKFRQD